MAMTRWRAFGEQRARQSARTRADFDDVTPSSGPAGAGDARGQVEIEEKILAERLFGAQGRGGG